MSGRDVGSLRVMRRARDRIDREYAEQVDVVALAARAGYSREHFIRAFRAAAERGGPAPIPGCFTLMWRTGLPNAGLPGTGLPGEGITSG